MIGFYTLIDFLYDKGNEVSTNALKVRIVP